MTGLRIMNFALLLGFNTLEYYGFDSCFGKEVPELIYDDDPRFEETKAKNKGAYYEDSLTGKKYAIGEGDEGGFFYAFKKKHHGSIQVATTPDGRRFLTSPVFAHQAKQFIKWRDRLEGKLNFILHGDNLTTHLLRCHLENIEKRKAVVGDKKWTDRYYPVFKEFFSRGNHMEISYETQKIVENAVIALKDSLGRDPTILDYDKALIESIEPGERYDLVTSLNLLEHIEIECIENVLKHIKSLSKYMVILHISLADTKDMLSNGNPAHLTSKAGQWWWNIITRHFIVAESVWAGGAYATFICQHYDAEEYINKEKGENQ